MRLIFLNKPSADSGGSSSFLSALAAELKRCGSEIVFGEAADDVRRQDVLLLNSWVTAYEKALPYWRAGVPILLRLDGAARDYGRFDDADRKQGRIAQLADEIVFQSEYCRRRLIERWDIVRESGRIIYNGVDTALFSPVGEKRVFPGEVKVAYVSHSTNFLKGFRRLVHLARKLPLVTFVACTPPRDAGWPDETLGAMPPPPNLLLPGRIAREDMPAVLRGCDILLSSSINDSCSSAVLEAMACGLPVWYHCSGGTPELVGDCGIAFSDEPASDLQRLLARRAEFSQIAREQAEKHFDITHVAAQYIEAAQELLSRKKRKSSIQRLYRRIKPARPFGKRDLGLPDLTVGYYLPCALAAYENVPASIWIRCFQMMRPLAGMGIKVRINPEPGEEIDLAVILRLENQRGVEIAEKLRQYGIPYIFDMVVNYLDRTRLPYDDSLEVTDEQYESTLRLMRDAVLVTTVSPWLADRASSFHPHTVCIPDAVPDAFFDVKKDAADFGRRPLRACYVGYATKSRDLQDWLPILQKHEIEVTIISEQQPAAGLKHLNWKKWEFAGLLEEVARHEIALAPRSDMSSPYNMGHSSFKIASLMACGLPVLASPIPSYKPLLDDGQAGRIVRNIFEFETALEAIVSDRDRMHFMSREARQRANTLAASRVATLVAQTIRQATAIAESQSGLCHSCGGRNPRPAGNR